MKDEKERPVRFNISIIVYSMFDSYNIKGDEMKRKDAEELVNSPIDLASYIIQITEEAEQLRINLVNEKMFHKNIRRRNKELMISNQKLLDMLAYEEKKNRMKDEVNKKLYNELTRWQNKFEKLNTWVKIKFKKARKKVGTACKKNK